MYKNVVIELGLNLDITWLKGIEKIMKVVKMRFIIWKKKNSITGENQDQDKSKYARKNLMLLPGENEKSKYIKVIT